MLIQDLREAAQAWHGARGSIVCDEALRQLTWAADDLLCAGASATLVHQTLLDEGVPADVIQKLLSP